MQVWQFIWHDVVEENLYQLLSKNPCVFALPSMVLFNYQSQSQHVYVNITIAKSHYSFVTVFKDPYLHPHDQLLPLLGNNSPRPYLVMVLHWLTVFWIEDVLSSQHKNPSFCLSFFRQWYVNGHLVSVKVGIVGPHRQVGASEELSPSIKTGSNAWI